MSSIKSDEEIEKLLNHKNNSVKVKIIGSGAHGKGGNRAGTKNDRSKENHSSAAVLAELVSGKAAAEIFEYTQSAVSKYRHGRNSNNDEDGELRRQLDEKLGRINGKIVDKVDTLLEIFAEDKMSELKAGELPPSIERLVSTYDKINRRHEKNEGAIRPQVLLWAPQQTNISNFVTKEVE